MKLILLYGPPAVGKLTIAKEIARLTGFKLFHAHLTSDLVEAIVPRGTPSFRKLAWDLRYAVFAEAAQAHLDGLIFTTVYGRDHREQFIARCMEVVAPFGGEVCFVHVHCQAETLRQRVVSEDRNQYGKITSVELLNEILSHGEPQALFEAGTLWDSLSLNTDVLHPVEAAQQVIAHYRLPTQHPNLHSQDSEEGTMENRLSALLSIVPPKPGYDPVRMAIDDADTKPDVAAVLKQFASMPPSTGVLANPVRHQQTVTCDNASLDLSIRSFTVRGMLMEEDIVRGAAGPLEVIFVGLFGRCATADQMTLFSNCIAHAFAAALVPDGRMPQLARFIKRFPEASPDIAMQHCASVRKAQRRSGGISGSRPPDALLAEMIEVHMENAAVGASASYMRSLLRTSPQMTESAMVDGVDRFLAGLHDKSPLHVCYSLVLRRAVHDTEARILDRFGAIQSIMGQQVRTWSRAIWQACTRERWPTCSPRPR